VIVPFVAGVARAETTKPSTQDLGPHGLPLTIDTPACAQIKPPAARVQDNEALGIPSNEKDLVILCPADSASGVFWIQLGPTSRKVKVWAEEIQDDEPGFTRWVVKTPSLLQWDVKGLAGTGSKFVTRVTLGKVEYQCFNAMPASAQDLAAELAACKSLRANKVP